MERSLDVPGPFRVSLSILLIDSLPPYFGTGGILGRRLRDKAIGPLLPQAQLELTVQGEKGG